MSYNTKNTLHKCTVHPWFFLCQDRATQLRDCTLDNNRKLTLPENPGSPSQRNSNCMGSKKEVLNPKGKKVDMASTSVISVSTSTVKILVWSNIAGRLKTVPTMLNILQSAPLDIRWITRFGKRSIRNLGLKPKWLVVTSQDRPGKVL